MKFMFEDLYQKQEELDQYIFDNHDVDRYQTMLDRMLALLVELGELANETRCFKYWSLTPPSAQEVIAGEFVDGIHFFLSLGIDINDDSASIKSIEVQGEMTDQFLAVFEAVVDLSKQFDSKHYVRAFALFLGIADKLGLDEKQIKDHYDQKNQTNHKRQENNY
jgi:dimeric dUTPase (all-alpha-NTP-PPase superfamily)